VKRILITGAGGPAGINFTKSLKLCPEKLFLAGAEANRYFATLASTDKVCVVPKATESGYIDALNVIAEAEDIEFIHPQPDVEVRIISENREKLNTSTFLPSKETIRICQDKLRSAEKWRKRNVPVAKTIELEDETDVERAFQELGHPLWIRARRGAGGRGSTPVNNLETARSWISYWRSRNKEWKFIAQEYLKGRNIAFHSLWKDGELITSMARERLQYIYPHLSPSGITGTPAVQRTIHDDNVNDIAAEAVLAIDSEFNGIACVDLMERDDGTPQATEINAGRMFTTSLFFSYASKKLLNNHWANFPYLYVKLAYHESLPDVPKHNILPKDLYWIRHIDAPARLVKAGKVIGTVSK